ncbi:MAG TPA: hypothetical protein VGM10_26440 [Actinocrinis sp.]
MLLALNATDDGLPLVQRLGEYFPNETDAAWLTTPGDVAFRDAFCQETSQGGWFTAADHAEFWGLVDEYDPDAQTLGFESLKAFLERVLAMWETQTGQLSAEPQPESVADQQQRAESVYAVVLEQFPGRSEDEQRQIWNDVWTTVHQDDVGEWSPQRIRSIAREVQDRHLARIQSERISIHELRAKKTEITGEAETPPTNAGRFGRREDEGSRGEGAEVAPERSNRGILEPVAAWETVNRLEIRHFPTLSEADIAKLGNFDKVLPISIPKYFPGLEKLPILDAHLTGDITVDPAAGVTLNIERGLLRFDMRNEKNLLFIFDPGELKVGLELGRVSGGGVVRTKLRLVGLEALLDESSRLVVSGGTVTSRIVIGSGNEIPDQTYMGAAIAYYYRGDELVGTEYW